MAVTVDRVASRADRRAFIDLPYRLHRNDPNFVPPLRIGEFEKIDERKHPFYGHARIDLYLARDGSRVVGRVAAIDDDLHNDIHGDNLLFFGFFEAEGPDAAAALFATVEERARELGRVLVRGPANPSMNDGSGFQIDAFDTQPYVMMPQNPPSYPDYAERAGYGKIKDLYAWRFDAVAGVGERLEKLADRVRERNRLTIRPADMGRLGDELAILKQIYTEAWEQNWGQVPYTEAEFDHLGNELKMIVDPEIVLFLEIDGKAIGVALGIPDVNQVLHRFNGRLLPFGIFHLLNRKRIIKRARLPILGVMPDYRNRGFELVLIEEVGRRGLERGYVEGELSWILEDNDGINKPIRATGAEVYKTYRLFQKAV
jgi:GNAT superfamily N-acetyltransferase